MKNIIVTKSYQFSLDVIGLYKDLKFNRKEFVLSKQVLRSATSIGANIEESQGAASKKDFINKLTIALKEAKETNYWLRLLRDSNDLDSKFLFLIKESEELKLILTSIIKTSQSK